MWWVRATPTVELALWMRHKIDGKQDVTDFSDVPALQSTVRFFFSSNQAGAEWWYAVCKGNVIFNGNLMHVFTLREVVIV